MASARVGLLGFGTVGSAVARRLTDRPLTSGSSPRGGSPDSARSTPGLTLTHVFDRRADEKRRQLDAPITWTSHIDDILQSDVDIVVEAVGVLDDAAEWTRAALRAGKSVVTANKQLVARHGLDLWALAERQGRQFRFEAAVGGAMPIVRAVADSLAGDRINRIVAILNGTTNAVLSAMDATGCSLQDALADARRNGYAEADPSADLRGDDARAKLAILCALAFNLRVDPSTIPIRTTEGLDVSVFETARQRHHTIRQLAHAELDRDRSTLTVWVAPVAVPRDSLFGRTVGPQNAAIITSEYSGEIGIFGVGAGGDATAVAILSDVLAVARDRAAIVPAPHVTADFSIADLGIETPAFVCSSSGVAFAEAV